MRSIIFAVLALAGRADEGFLNTPSQGSSTTRVERLEPPAPPSARTRVRRERRVYRTDEDYHAKVTNQLLRSFMGEPVHEPKGPRHRRTIPPPRPLSEVAGAASGGIPQSPLPRAWGVVDDVSIPLESPEDAMYLTTKQAARDHVEKTLGHHRHRRRRRRGPRVTDHSSEL